MPTDHAQRADNRLLVLLVAGIGGMVALMGALLAVFFVSTAEDAPERPWPAAQAEPEPAPLAPAAVREPAPAPIAGAEAGYGRPEPLFPSDGQGAQPVRDSLVPQVQVQAVGGGVEIGTLPGRFGNPYAPVKLVVFNDFQCPFCGRLEATFEALHQRYPSQIELYFRDFPLEMHKQARGAHMAARCAHDQGRFWAMHDLLFANQRALEPAQLVDYAAQLELNTASFQACLERQHHATAIDADIAAAKAAEVRGTPATFVNGTLVSGARPVEAFIEVIEGAM
jgi:protein-disulfide isomerase